MQLNVSRLSNDSTVPGNTKCGTLYHDLIVGRKSWLSHNSFGRGCHRSVFTGGWMDGLPH